MTHFLPLLPGKVQWMEEITPAHLMQAPCPKHISNNYHCFKPPTYDFFAEICSCGSNLSHILQGSQTAKALVVSLGSISDSNFGKWRLEKKHSFCVMDDYVLAKISALLFDDFYFKLVDCDIWSAVYSDCFCPALRSSESNINLHFRPGLTTYCFAFRVA